MSKPKARAVPAMPPPQPELAQMQAVVDALNAGRLEDAQALSEALTQRFPLHGFAWKSLGVALQRGGRWTEALRATGRAVELLPRDAQAHANHGAVLADLGRMAQAEASARRALEIDPGYFDALNNLGRALTVRGAFAEAEAVLRRAVAARPASPEALNNLGLALQEQGRREEAVACYRGALEQNPLYFRVHVNQGVNLQEQGLLVDAQAWLQRAIAIEPQFVEAWVNLGSCLNAQGLLDEAIAAFRRALALRPDDASAWSNLLFSLNYHPRLGAAELFAAYRDYNARFAAGRARPWPPAAAGEPAPGRRLRIGYVSGDFRVHSCLHFLEPLMQGHDKAAVEVFAYSEVGREDAATARYRSFADHWRVTRGMPDAAVAQLIGQDGIDVLVDLAGHTLGNRLGVFALKPAPVSVSWLGFGYTTGLDAIDYFLGDAVLTPPGCEPLFSEKPWRLGRTSFAYRPAPGMGEAGPLPAAARGHVTFGSLSRAVRLNEPTLAAWAAILRRVPGSRLVIDNTNFRDPRVCAAHAARFAALGIEAHRLDIGFHSPPWDSMRGIDIGLDCFPHNNGTTLFEMLYMGIPVVTLAGRPSTGLLGSTVLAGAGLSAWVAHSVPDYVELAVARAGDLAGLAALRAGLRARMQASELMDEAGFCRDVESAFRAMWEAWRSGREAAP